MENKILELLERKGSVSMNDDIFPLVEKEFEGQVIGTELYELAHQYISQLLYGVHTAGVAFNDKINAEIDSFADAKEQIIKEIRGLATLYCKGQRHT